MPPLMDYTSKKDPTRENVGKIYTDAQKTKERVEVGDMRREMMKSLITDLNDSLKQDHFNGSTFYVNVYEKKDLQMKNAILRRLYVSKYRPWPEDDTMVFKMEPTLGRVSFCWCLPHWSEMDNMIRNDLIYDLEMVNNIRSWKMMDYYPFGFIKDQIGNWKPNPNWKDKVLN